MVPRVTVIIDRLHCTCTFAGLDEVYHRAASSIRTIRGSIGRGPQGGLSKKKESTTWVHKFVCLDTIETDRIPTTQGAKIILEEAGLGEKLINVPLDCSPEELQDAITAVFPKLKNAGGFELCRCTPNSRELVPIATRVASTPKILKRRVGNGRVYIRPLQRDLSLEIDEDEDIVGVIWFAEGCMHAWSFQLQVSHKCLECGLFCPSIKALKEHLAVCRENQDLVSLQYCICKPYVGLAIHTCMHAAEKSWLSAGKLSAEVF